MPNPFIRYIINNRIIERIQIEEEFSQLIAAMRSAGVKKVLEIGFWHGGTAMGFDEVISKGEITSIDKWAISDDYADFLQKNKAFRNDFRYISGNSNSEDTIKEAWKRAPFDMLFIDGDHTADAVLQDYRNYSPMVKPDGMIVFHDIRLLTDAQTKQEGVAPAYSKIAKSHNHIEIVYPYPDYLPYKEGFGIGIIYQPL